MKADRIELWKLRTVDERAAAQSYIDWCRSVLGLPHWNIYVSDKMPCPKDAYADVDVNATRYMARVRLNPEWTSLDPWAQANALMHECLHVSVHQLTEGTTVEIVNAFSAKKQRTFNMIEARSKLEEERLCDQLATALTDSLRAVDAWKRIRAAHGLEA
jgi:hypothetical protein